MSQDKGGWWTGEKGGCKGLFPSRYVQLLRPLPAAPPLPDRNLLTVFGGSTRRPGDLNAATDLRHQADKLVEQVTAAAFSRTLYVDYVCHTHFLGVLVWESTYEGADLLFPGGFEKLGRSRSALFSLSTTISSQNLSVPLLTLSCPACFHHIPEQTFRGRSALHHCYKASGEGSWC